MSVPPTTRSDISHRALGVPVRTLTAGLNAWAAADLLPWLYMEDPTWEQTFLHMLPAVGLAFVVFLLTRASQVARDTLVPGLIALFPLSVGLAVVVREGSLDEEIPTVALLYCVLSMWVFVGAATTETRRMSSTSPAKHALAPIVTRFNLRTLLVATAALSTTVVAPRWLPREERSAAWLQVSSEGQLLTVACATALALGILFVMMGSESMTPVRPTRVPLRQRLVPPMLAATFGAVVYAVITSGT